MHRDYWATPTYDAPVVPPGHVDSQCPIWLSPHTYKPLHYGLAHVSKAHVTLAEYAATCGMGLGLMGSLINAAGIQKINDEEYLLSDLEAKVVPLLPPSCYVPIAELRETIKDARSEWAQPLLSKERADWCVDHHKWFSPESVARIEVMIREYKENK